MSRAPNGDLQTLYRSLSPARRTELLTLALLMPVTAIAEMLMIAAIVPFLSALVPGGDPDTVLAGLLAQLERLWPAQAMVAAATLFIPVVIITSILRLTLTWKSLRFSAELGHDLTMEVQRRMLHQPYLFHVSSHSSRLVASLDKIDELVLGYILRGLQFVSALVITVALVAALMLVDAKSAAIAMLLLTALYGAALLIDRTRFRRLSEYLPVAHEQRIRLSQENLGAIRDIILDRSQEAHLDQFREVDRQFSRARTDISFLSSAPRYVVEGVGLSLIAVAATLIWDGRGGLLNAVPTVGALALGGLRLMPLASQLYSSWVTMTAARPMVHEVANLLNLPMPEPPVRSAPLPFMRKMELESVGLHYAGRPQAALHDINLTIPRGSRVAIVGRSGSGKSTLADLLMGLIEPTAGQVRVDGELLAGAALATWRMSVAHVPQSIFVADASIARNIALGAASGLDLERIERAAGMAQLAEFVASLPEGYQTSVGERGIRLSGGQRQRLALARAIYRKPRLLVLDEATSALDNETEAAVMASLDQVHAEGCTIVIVAHRLSTVQRCDRIFMLDDGMLIQSGSFTELFGRLNRLHEQGEL